MMATRGERVRKRGREGKTDREKETTIYARTTRKNQYDPLRRGVQGDCYCTIRTFTGLTNKIFIVIDVIVCVSGIRGSNTGNRRRGHDKKVTVQERGAYER